MNVKESNVNDISKTSSENVIELNSTKQDMLHLKKYNEDPIIYGLSNVLSKEECEYLLSKYQMVLFKIVEERVIGLGIMM